MNATLFSVISQLVFRSSLAYLQKHFSVHYKNMLRDFGLGHRINFLWHFVLSHLSFRNIKQQKADHIVASGVFISEMFSKTEKDLSARRGLISIIF